MTSTIVELVGDLFSVDDSISLAHCVSADFRMGKGIAAEFKRRYGAINSGDTGCCVGDVFTLSKSEDAYIFYLVTKEKYYNKPTYESLKSCLIELKKECEQLKVTKLAIPRIGCGLDKLEWAQVKTILIEVFADSDINISVFRLA